MALKWVDSLDIALALLDEHPEVDPKQLHFPQLMQWVIALDEFDDDPNRCSERILEAIQQAWIDEVD
ncbi:Fe-S assembly protein IscX [Thalassotalea euphylliae]|uniref:Fe-S assembly protein IscX n=1 Tax=Thalassotalea euphylliae TaxID=1655234 RepID=A0A3E0TPB4_9GAMM|nr:Fe-S cluster assembly protein IscX [Thalassotalea euphylliae]REL25825.1 Fe-S assembly protein IscX [Thalassotalea euphylliae]